MKLTIVRLYHELLGTYGDQGNAEILIHRAKARGITTHLHEVEPGTVVPTHGDIYLIGGGEDGPQALALEMLRADGNLAMAVNQGATVLAVCAGFQLLGNSLPNASGQTVSGLGLLDVDTIFSDEPRCVGEVVSTRLIGDQVVQYTGFENHQGRTRLGHDVSALGVITLGFGNGIADEKGQQFEGARVGKVFGTYLHGPVLARNPHLADEVLSSAMGQLTPYDDALASDLAQERLSTLLRGRTQ